MKMQSSRPYNGFKICFVIILMIIFVPLVNLLAEEFRYDRGTRKDPFVPLVGPGGLVKSEIQTSDLNIEGIIFDPKKGSMVLINGEFYKEGDRVKSANVVSIFKDRVILVQNDKEKILWLREELIPEGEKKNEQIPASPNANKK